MDILFIEILQILFEAGQTKKSDKILLLHSAAIKLDSLKFLLFVAWEIKALTDKKYINLSESLNEVGRMLGGWLRSSKQNSPEVGEK